jgi:hypothetical protein
MASLTASWVWVSRCVLHYRFADYVDETLKVYFLGGLGVLRGIYPSF